MKKAVVTAAVILAGCATYIPVQKESGEFSLSYASSVTGAAVPEVIAFVSPEFSTQDAGKGNTVNYQISMPSFYGQPVGDKAPFIAANQFNERYQQQFAVAVQNALEDMYQKRGFKTKGPYETYDDISFTDKKSLYLVSSPKFNMYFDQNVTKMECRNNNQICRSEGNFRLRGEVVYRLLEPLTKQSLLTRRIDIGSFGITKNYVKEFQSRTVSQGLSGAVWDKLTSPEKLIDSTDRAMSEAVSEAFSRAMPKLDNTLSKEEILGFKQDIAQLKTMKQY